MQPSLLTTERRTSLDELGDPAAAPGSRPWAVWVRDQLQASLHDTSYSAERLQGYRDAIRQHEGWRQLSDPSGFRFRSYAAFCKAKPPFGLGRPAEEIDALLAERKSAQEHAEAPLTLLPDKGPATDEERLSINNNVINRPTRQGNDPGYLTARIARDHKDILARMRAGEFPSVRAAALEAGIVKPRVQVEPTPEGLARAARKHIPEQIAELVRLLEGEVG
jgi:hypothetical protein